MSVVNAVMASASADAVTVGMGATILHHSDREPATVIEVRSEKRIVIRTDNATRTDKNGMSESQEYAYAPDPDGSTYIVTKRKDGRWKIMGDGRPVLVGHREKYHDFNF